MFSPFVVTTLVVSSYPNARRRLKSSLRTKEVFPPFVVTTSVVSSYPNARRRLKSSLRTEEG
ncbi:MAG: hypothetical protein ACRC8Y_00590, partial [Chroococcales cyanobacterium]